MKEKIKIQKGFIQIPLLVIIIASISVASAGIGFVLYKQGKLTPLVAPISEAFKGTEEAAITEEIKPEEPQIEQPEINQEEITQQELEKAELLAEAEKAKLEAEKTRAEIEQLKKEMEQVRKFTERNSAEELLGPSITEVIPRQIFNNITSLVRIKGENFKKGTRVFTGQRSVDEVTVVDDKTIIIKILPGLSGTVHDIQVMNPDGKAAALENALVVVNVLVSQPKTFETLDLATIIKLWRPYVAYIECDFSYTNGVKYLTQAGSGFVIAETPPIYVYTNKHVLVDRDRYTPDMCRVYIPNDNNIFSVYSENIKISKIGHDFGAITITNPDNYITENLDYSEIKEYQDSILCHQKASLGDEVVILGYPSIGSQTDITATRGIISGYDGNYYITDAKVEHGNSGGLAILIKDNCYLGIPTFVQVGSIESLARILDFNAELNY